MTARIVTKEEANTYQWWSDYLAYRMIAIQAILALDQPEQNIHNSIGTDPEQINRLIAVAKHRQAHKEILT